MALPINKKNRGKLANLIAILRVRISSATSRTSSATKLLQVLTAGLLLYAIAIRARNNAADHVSGRISGNDAVIKVERSSAKVLVQTVSIGRGKHIARDNHESYCNKWNYEYNVVDHIYNKSLSAYWQKLPATLDMMQNTTYDYIFWIDTDAFFVNCEQSLDHLIRRMVQDNSTWLFSGDTLIINSGQLLWKNTERSKQILDQVLALWYPKFDQEQEIFENGAFAAYLGGARRPDRNEIRQAYKRANKCWISRKSLFKSRQVCQWIQMGDRKALEDLDVNEDLLEAITFVPQHFINSYSWGPAKFDDNSFIFHCAGRPNKEKCFRNFLRKTKKTERSLICS